MIELTHGEGDGNSTGYGCEDGRGSDDDDCALDYPQMDYGCGDCPGEGKLDGSGDMIMKMFGEMDGGGRGQGQ